MSSTIKDVAKKAGVSIATVSLVIHNNERISLKTRKKVQKIIDELDYHPTRSAMGLVSRTSGNIGFILTDDHFSRSEPFYTKIFLGTEFQAREKEYYILLTTIPSTNGSKNKIPRFVLERNVDGIILAGKIPKDFLDQLGQYNVPLVFVDYLPEHKQFPAVMIDNIDGGYRATQHLINCGHKKIAFIGGDLNHPSIAERIQGYKNALEISQLPFDSQKVVIDELYPSRKNGYSAMEKLLNRNLDFSAIFACNDAMAIGALQCLKERNMLVPKDISIIGFDDVESDLSIDPPLTTIAVPKEDMGIEAVKLLLESLSKKPSIPRKVLMPVKLVVRKSTCDYKHN
jgi:LacI family transcriptional regulator